jgi:hypothetical protein
MSNEDKQLDRENEVVAPSYCVKDKANQPIGWFAVVTMKNGRTAARGICRGEDAVGRECGNHAYTFNGNIINQVRERIKEQSSV